MRETIDEREENDTIYTLMRGLSEAGEYALVYGHPETAIGFDYVTKNGAQLLFHVEAQSRTGHRRQPASVEAYDVLVDLLAEHIVEEP